MKNIVMFVNIIYLKEKRHTDPTSKKIYVIYKVKVVAASMLRFKVVKPEGLGKLY